MTLKIEGGATEHYQRMPLPLNWSPYYARTISRAAQSCSPIVNRHGRSCIHRAVTIDGAHLDNPVCSIVHLNDGDDDDKRCHMPINHYRTDRPNWRRPRQPTTIAYSIDDFH